jgi:Mor family transcriptional regulator
MHLPDHYPDILADIAQLLNARLQQHLPAEQAAALALAQAEDLRLTFNGCQIYIPKGDHYERAQRDAEIAAAFNGRNHAELARRYHLTVTQVYDILNRQRLGRQSSLLP